MDLNQLKEKALSLPYAPGVYIMRDKTNTVIYVGKAKKLKNRVSQYFQDTASHTLKTRMMVSKIDHFDVIIASSEFEALVLECSLIKRYQPRYNILLKDDKGYPYLRIDSEEAYPTITMVSKAGGKGEFFGPFGSRSVTGELLVAIKEALMLPTCSKRFPRDIGKGRPCLNYHMNQCAGWCQGNKTEQQYLESIDQARQMLQGNYKQVAQGIRKRMLEAAENLHFEVAAELRDRLNAVEMLGQKQLVIAGKFADLDVIGYGQTEAKGCFAVLHYRDGNLIDKDYEVFPVPDDPAAAVSSLVKQYYLSRGFAPKLILLPFEMEDSELFSQLMEEKFHIKTHFRIPQRGSNLHLLQLALSNAEEEANRVTDAEERVNKTLALLGKMLSIDPPGRIESYDISNISGTDTVASMVVFQDGKPRRSEYKRFKIEGLEHQDDYASMEQVLLRRFQRLVDGDKNFSALPDLLLIDGGANHAAIAVRVLESFQLTVPVFGMVKDDRHRTRALVTSQGEEIRIDSKQAVFALIGNIQEETHNFAIRYHRKLRSKRLQYSELDDIPGIGPKRKQQLLKKYKSLTAIRQASLQDLERLLPRDAAMAVYNHFNRGEEA